MARYDVIIKNGLVFDGRGNEPERVDLGLSGDEVKKIGDLKDERAGKIIDATDKYVSPGFIDLTNHSDTHWTLFSQPSQESLLYQGITTVIGGNCGSSLAPFIGEGSIDEIQRWVDVSKININWRTMEEFLSLLEGVSLGLNFGTLIGFNTIQKSILGKEVRTPTEEEINQMRLLLRSSLEQGAFGISTNFGFQQIKSLGDEDIIKILKLDKKDVLIKHHLEDEGENILPAISRLMSLTRKVETKMHISHFKVLGRGSWKLFPDAIEMIRKGREEGIKITVDLFPYTKTGSSLLMLLPSWLRKLSNDEVYKVLQLKANGRRGDLINYLKSLTLHYDKIIVASAGAELGMVGKTIEQLSRAADLSEEEIILSLLEINELRVSIFNEVILEENIDLIAQENFSALASDGVGYQLSAISYQPSAFSDLPHPRSFGAFTRAFNLLVKEKSVLTWPEAIYKMSGLPADILGLKERGTLEQGKKADLVVFDPQEISDLATYDNPFQYSQGVSDVLVNGEMVIDNKNFTGKLAGRVLRKK